MIGDKVHAVVFQNPVTTPTPYGGIAKTWTDVPPGRWFASVDPASPNDLERFTAGTVITQLAYIVRADFCAGVSTATRMLFNGRTFAIAGFRNLRERSIDMELLAVELQEQQQ